MLPFSALREAVSKSNSESLVPSTTTTLVSSGWLASINMRRAIGALLEAWGTDRRERPVRPCRLSGARGTVRFDPPNGLLNLAKTGKVRIAGPDGPILPTSRFLISRRQGRRLRKGRYKRRRLLAKRNIRCSRLPDNQKIGSQEIVISR